MREPNLEKLNALVGKLVGDLGISLGGASILLGDRLGLYKAMADGEPVKPSELAKKTGLHERYVREWLGAQAGEGRLRQVVTEAGFKRFRRATETPFNMIFEARS
jgi:hypothetical protein